MDVGRDHLIRSTWFNITHPEFYWTVDGDLVEPPDRLAEIYVFAWHGEERETVADDRAPEQWRLFVVPATSLRPKQSDIGLLDLKKLTDSVEHEALIEAIQEVIDGF